MLTVGESRRQEGIAFQLARDWFKESDGNEYAR